MLYQILFKLFLVETWSSTPKLLKQNRNEKHLPLKTTITYGAKKSKSGVVIYRSISQQGVKFSIIEM